MNPNIKSRLKRTAVLSLAALCIGALIAFVQIQNENAAVTQKPGAPMAVAGVQIGGNFTLTDQGGNTVTEKNFAGKYKLIYFGFTFCPAVCPTELAKMTRALNMLGGKADAIQPLFITVDPDRDTPQIMGSYVKAFYPRLIGLTGTQAQIDAVLKSYRIYAKKVQTPEMSDYTMDHSSFIYLMSPDDTLIAIYRSEDTAEFIAEDIENKL